MIPEELIQEICSYDLKEWRIYHRSILYDWIAYGWMDGLEDTHTPTQCWSWKWDLWSHEYGAFGTIILVPVQRVLRQPRTRGMHSHGSLVSFL